MYTAGKSGTWEDRVKEDSSRTLAFAFFTGVSRWEHTWDTQKDEQRKLDLKLGAEIHLVACRSKISPKITLQYFKKKSTIRWDQGN